MPENAIGLAKVETQLQFISKQIEHAESSRRETYQLIHNVDKKVDGIDYRLGSLETAFADAKPKIAEFMTYTNRVEGAGMLGRALWVFGGVILGAAAWLTGALQSITNMGK